LKHVAQLLSVLLAACGAEPADEAPSALVDVEPPPWCAPPPFAVLHGPGFGTWASPTCKGDIARGATAVGWNDPTPRRCAQWVTGVETEAEVLCVDLASSVERIYYHPPYTKECSAWGPTLEAWFIWRSCGVQPVYAPAGDEI